MSSQASPISTAPRPADGGARSLRTAKWLLAFMIGCFIFSTTYISGLIIERQESLLKVSRYNTVWLASQSVAEFVRLQQRISAFQDLENISDKEEILLRFEILVNRTNLLQDGEFNSFIRSNPDQNATVRDLSKAIEDIEPVIATIDQPHMRERALGIMAPLDTKLAALASAANQFGASRVLNDQGELVRLHWLSIAFTFGLVACGVALTALLLWQNRLLDQLHIESVALAHELWTETFLHGTTLDNIDQGIIFFDENGTTKTFNRRISELLSLSREFLEGEPSFELIQSLSSAHRRVDSDHESLKTALDSCAREKKRHVCEITSPYGTVLELRTIFLENGSAVCTYTDISDRKAAETAKDNFLSQMSHEIRTPLTGLLGVADLLSAEDLSKRQLEFVLAIQSCGRHLMSIVNNILDFSRIEANELKLEHIEFSLSALLGDIKRMMEHKADERGLELMLDLKGDLPSTIVGDPMRLAQVLLNLVGNGIKFTDFGSVTIKVSSETTRESRLKIQFKVIDTGCGIAEFDYARVFSPFVQSDSSTTRRFGGSGLGLAISQRLVEMMGSIIHLRSAIGKGSEFWFDLLADVGSDVKDAKQVSLFSNLGVPRRILLAEDVELNRRLLVEVLERAGHNVIIATNGAEAVEIAAKDRFDVILMDVQMPVMDGLEATRRIRNAWGGEGATRIVGLTAFALPEKLRECFRAGMDECLLKPVNWESLLAAVNGPVAALGADESHFDVRVSENNRDVIVSPSCRPPESQKKSALESPAAFELRQEALRAARNLCAALWLVPSGSKEFLNLAHELKGMASLFGFERVSALAGELEIVGADTDEVKHLLMSLEACIVSSVINLRTFLPR